jgi:hypothetical protein
LAIGLGEPDARAFLPPGLALRRQEHIGAYFEPFPQGSPLAGLSSADVHNRDPRVLPLVASGATLVGDGVLAKLEDANAVLCQLTPWTFDPHQAANLKRTYRRASFLVTRLLANLGVAGTTPLLDRWRRPVDPASGEKRWRQGLYLDTPEEWDDPYRFFRW